MHRPINIRCIYIFALVKLVNYKPMEVLFGGSCWGNRREEDHCGDRCVDGRIILGWISKRWDVGIWTGLGWPRIETGGGRL